MAVTTAADGWVSFWTDKHLGSGEGIGGYAAFVAASLIVGFAANVPQRRGAGGAHPTRTAVATANKFKESYGGSLLQHFSTTKFTSSQQEATDKSSGEDITPCFLDICCLSRRRDVFA